MVRSPRATLEQVIQHPRSLDLAVLVVAISAACTAGYLSTQVGQLAGLDQQVRQFEAFGVEVTDDRYAQLRRLAPYRPIASAAAIVVGWPLAWAALAWIVQRIGERVQAAVSYAQALAVVVHASAILAVRSVVALPINYARESLGGATSLALLMPAFGESTFPARLFSAVDLFLLWWTALMAMGLGRLYGRPTMSIARWLLGAYAAGAIAVATVQALRGGF
jgi:hypothetical protein